MVMYIGVRNGPWSPVQGLGDRLVEWGKLYANLVDDPRVQAVEDECGGAWLLIESMCYCTRAESDAFIPHTQVQRFGGGEMRATRVAALVRERLWIEVERGYMLDPELWSEDRNLNGSAERKKEADRNRQRKNRAEKAARGATVAESVADLSRDNPATCRATGSRDDRALDQSREDQSSSSVVGQLQQPDARATDDDDGLVASVAVKASAKAKRPVSAAEAQAIIATVLERAERAGTPVHNVKRYVEAAIDAARDVHDLIHGTPPPLAVSGPAVAAPRTAHCGDRECSPVTRRREDRATGADLGLCPKCGTGARRLA